MIDTQKEIDNTNQKENNNKNTLLKEVIDFVRDLILIIVVVLIIRSFFILPFQISWQSMYTSYYDRQFIIVDRFSYLDLPIIWPIREPVRWDAVVFNTHIDGKEYFIKRIIWLPWDIVKIEDWIVYIKSFWNDEFIELEERWYLTDENYRKTYVRNWDNIFEIPKNSYFVLWDNRNASTDSRNCFSSCSFWDKTHFVDKKDIVWKVFIDLWYFNFRNMDFYHPNLWITTKPTFFSSKSTYEY